jgi:hypothetical protein
VAIKFLTDAGVRPNDYMALYSDLPIAHAFVLVGGERNGTANNPGTWGASAVVCDPWHGDGKVYLATRIESRMYRGPANYRFHGPL